ncbi:MAG: hypothetical protein HY900_32020, partial [Deltaproteobacteria bacterium]|nr:hypothetical protein [Deltaproteobacteria bacterium]
SEATGPCMGCRLCEHVCPMGIDIRKGSFQIECTRCGSCVDACTKVLQKKKRPSLLEFDFSAISFRQWDAKRILVAISTVGFGAALAWAVATRETISFRLSPVYTESASTSSSGTAQTSFLLRATNKGKVPVRLDVTPEGLPAGAAVLSLGDGQIPASTEKRFTLVVRVPRSAVLSSVTQFRLVIRAAGRAETFPAALLVSGRKTS